MGLLTRLQSQAYIVLPGAGRIAAADQSTSPGQAQWSWLYRKPLKNGETCRNIPWINGNSMMRIAANLAFARISIKTWTIQQNWRIFNRWMMDLAVSQKRKRHTHQDNSLWICRWPTSCPGSKHHPSPIRSPEESSLGWSLECSTLESDLILTKSLVFLLFTMCIQNHTYMYINNHPIDRI